MMRCSRNRTLLLAIFLCLATLFCFSGPAPAHARSLEMQTEDERLVRWDLTADNLVTLNDSEVMEASGNVFLRRGSEYLKADFARYYMSTKWVYLRGNVVVRTGKDEIKAEEAEFDLRSRTGWLRKGEIFMAGPHAYITGEHINKHWGDVYTFKQAKVTTCDGDVPAWSFTAEEAVVEIDGYARLTRSSFQVKDQPVAYTPYFIFPVKTKRQTGLLFPEYGSSSRKGMFYTQPFFWAIDDSNDMTISETWMEKSGFMHGVEFRTRPDEDTAGWVRMDWLYDKTRITDDSQGAYGGDDLIRKNRERFWLRGMYDTRLPDPSWRFKADLDYVSDQDYLSEFKSQYGGFNKSRDTLFSIFSRQLQEKDRDRVSGALLTREWERASIALSSTYTQDQSLGNGNAPHSEDTTVQHLPQFDAFLYKGRIVPTLPFEVEGNMQAGYMYRRSGTRGAKYQASPKLVLPLHSRYGGLIASAGVTQTYYETETPSRSDRDRGRGTSDSKEDGTTRTIADYSVAASTELSRVYSMDKAHLRASNATLGESQWLSFKHAVQPRVEYRQRPFQDQDDLPRYEFDDRMEPRTELVYSLTNLIMAKSERVTMRLNEETGELEPVLEEFYRDVLRLRLEQIYDIREADRNEKRDEYERRPYGDVLGELTAYVTDTVSLTTKNEWSPYLNEITRHQSGVTFSFPEYGSLYAGFDLRSKLDEYKRTRDDRIRYLKLRGNIVGFNPFTLSFTYNYDMENSDNRETELMLTYNHQCFQLIGSMIIEPQEESYHFSIVLTGLGDE